MSDKDKDNYYDLSDEQDVQKIGIHELDLNTLYPRNQKDFKNGVKYVMIGKPGTGKSTVIKHLIYSKKHIFPVAHVFSGTEDSNGFFGSFIPPLFVTQGLDVKNLNPLENFRKRQKIVHQYLEPIGQNPWAIEVIDDCTSDKSFLKRPIVQEIYKNGRHWRMMHILSLQYCMDLPAEIRGSVDGTFIFRETNATNREKLFKNYGGCVGSLSEWNDLMDQLTEDYHCIYVKNNVQSNNIEDCIFYFKADLNLIPKNWKFGCKEYWTFAEERYNKNYTEGFN